MQEAKPRKPEIQEKERLYQETNMDRFRWRKLESRWKYLKFTQEEFDVLYDKQGGCCLLCGSFKEKDAVGSPNRLVVDHDHVTMKIRGLLCSKCNIAVGHIEMCLGFRPDLFQWVRDYLGLAKEGNTQQSE